MPERPPETTVERHWLDAIHWTDVSSTNVRRIAFEDGAARSVSDAALGTLVVEFAGGGLYRYRNVPKGTFHALVMADRHPEGSVGGLIARLVKGKFETEKLRVEEPVAANAPPQPGTIAAAFESVQRARRALDDVEAALEDIELAAEAAS